MSDSLSNRIFAVLEQSPVIDGHNDLLIRLRSKARYNFDEIDIAVDQSDSGLHTDLPRMRAGGLGGQFWSVFVPVTLAGESAVTATLEQIDAAHQMIDRYDALTLTTTADQVSQALSQGQIASLLGMEGGHSIGCSLGTLRMMYRLGVRYMTLTHTSNTPWADSATDAPGVGGLSEFGREVVREMNRLGMLVDLSHVAPSTMNAALDVSDAPAFFSHSNALALCSHPRNVPDQVLARVGDTQGVVMATFVPGFLTEDGRHWMDAFEEFEENELNSAFPDDPRAGERGYQERRELRQRWMADNPCPPCSTADVADHIEHIRDVAGVDCVGLGGDLDGISTTPNDIPDVTAYPIVLERLADRGWSDDDLAKLTSGNVIRVLRETESVARRASAERGPSHRTIEELDG
jgi:membrane dipeptidase